MLIKNSDYDDYDDVVTKIFVFKGLVSGQTSIK